MTPDDIKSILRPKGMCGTLLPDGLHACILSIGHDSGVHEPQGDQAPVSMDRTAIEEWTAERIAVMLERDRSVYLDDATSSASVAEFVVGRRGGHESRSLVADALDDAISAIRHGAWRR